VFDFLVPFATGHPLAYHGSNSRKAHNELQFQSFDAHYLQRLKDGDPVVEEHFAAYFRELIYLKCRWRVSSAELIEDIQQETLYRVLQTVGRGAIAQPERFGAFVNSVCNNVTLELRRNAHKHEPVEDKTAEPVDPGEDLDDRLINGEDRRKVRSTLEELPEKDRNLLRTVFLEEKTPAEACRQFGVDPDYLRVLIFRAKQRFKKAYQRSTGTSGASG
jgi:RNA polymerase sigma-70 factor (ECF subfamily)